jgi:plasmid stability protein
MPTLYVRNVPKDLYAALRKRARANGRSIAAEVRVLLKENVPTADDLKAPHDFCRQLKRLRKGVSKAKGPFQTAEEMIREDRER